MLNRTEVLGASEDEVRDLFHRSGQENVITEYFILLLTRQSRSKSSVLFSGY